MFCTRCKKEYGDGVTVCPDCKQELVEKAEEEIETVEAMKPVKVASAANSTEAGLIMNLLRNNGIQCFKKDNGIGGYMNIYYGFSVYGEEIYVDESDFDKASEIVKELSPVQAQESDLEDAGEAEDTEEIEQAEDVDGKDDQEEALNKEEDSYQNYPFYRSPQTLARIFLIGAIGIAAVIYVLSKIIN